MISGRYGRLTPPSVAQAILDGLAPAGAGFTSSSAAPAVRGGQREEYFEVVGGFLE